MLDLSVDGEASERITGKLFSMGPVPGRGLCTCTTVKSRFDHILEGVWMNPK